MKLVKTVLRRPMTAALLVVALMVFGATSIVGMPLEYFPDMNMPMELVTVMWPGADADSIQRLVTQSVRRNAVPLQTYTRCPPPPTTTTLLFRSNITMAWIQMTPIPS